MIHATVRNNQNESGYQEENCGEEAGQLKGNEDEKGASNIMYAVIVAVRLRVLPNQTAVPWCPLLKITCPSAPNLDGTTSDFLPCCLSSMIPACHTSLAALAIVSPLG